MISLYCIYLYLLSLKELQPHQVAGKEDEEVRLKEFQKLQDEIKNLRDELQQTKKVVCELMEENNRKQKHIKEQEQICKGVLETMAIKDISNQK